MPRLNAGRDVGLVGKYTVQRVDRSPKHRTCKYFVLDVSHDPHAIPAILAYADACEKDGFVPLAEDLRRLARGEPRIHPQPID